MNYLIVDNGIIENIIVADEVFAESIGAVSYYDGAEIGAEYDPPEPTPEPTAEETQNDMINMLVDYEYRLTLLEV